MLGLPLLRWLAKFLQTRMGIAIVAAWATYMSDLIHAAVMILMQLQTAILTTILPIFLSTFNIDFSLADLFANMPQEMLSMWSYMGLKEAWAMVSGSLMLAWQINIGSLIWRKFLT